MAADQASPQPITLSSSGLQAAVSPRGAELVALKDRDGRDLLWNGDPAFWTGRAPLLFPIVGRLKDDTLTVDGKGYPMRQHGFARTTTFDLVASDASSCRFRLSNDEETRRHYPFAFVLEVTYALEATTLAVTATVTNSGSAPLPASFGFHPAFRWPLPYGADRAAHRLVFERPESDALRRVEGGLLSPTAYPSPIRGRELALDDALFAADALIFLHPDSRSVRFGPPEGPSLRVDYPEMPQLGVWTKPGAPFLCIEPWSGYASPADFDGPFADKPGLSHIEPGQLRHFGFSVTLEGE